MHTNNNNDENNENIEILAVLTTLKSKSRPEAGCPGLPPKGQRVMVLSPSAYRACISCTRGIRRATLGEKLCFRESCVATSKLR